MNCKKATSELNPPYKYRQERRNNQSDIDCLKNLINYNLPDCPEMSLHSSDKLCQSFNQLQHSINLCRLKCIHKKKHHQLLPINFEKKQQENQMCTFEVLKNILDPAQMFHYKKFDDQCHVAKST